MKNLLVRVGLELLYALLLLVTLDVLPVGLNVLGIVFAFVFASTFWFDVRNRIMFVVSILLGFFVLNLFSQKSMARTYYRPHEILRKQLMAGFKRYAPNQDVTVDRAHGDLVALGFNHPEVESIQEIRKERLVTDENGYPKLGKAHGNFQALLVGDSFIAGDGNDAADTVAAQLQAKGYDVYALGYAGNIAEYLASVTYAEKSLDIHGPAFIFAFEGNDFAGEDYCVSPGSRVGITRNINRAIKETHIARFFAALWGHVVSSRQSPAIEVAEVGGKKIGFFVEYLNNARVKEYDNQCLSQLFQQHRNQIAGIFFIPEKARVYGYGGIGGQSAYAKYLSAVAKEIGVPFVDLTLPLKKRAQELLQSGKYVYWRDDTHWNREGAAIAVREMENLLTRSPR